MKTKNFSFNVPKELIAQQPAPRGQSRLLIVDREKGSFEDDRFVSIADLIPRDGVLIFNNSKVRKARFFAKSETGAAVEFVLLKRISPCEWTALVSKAQRQKIGRRYLFPGGREAVISGEEGMTKTIRFSDEVSDEYIETRGKVPLPPYIKRDSRDEDDENYQTVYAEHIGSAAAPTAGLHFTEKIIQQLESRGVQIVYVTLHVGIGTFLPIRSDSIIEHKMHPESYSIGREEAAVITEAKRDRRPVIAVGTTSVRTIESAYRDGTVIPGSDTTSLYIYPGYTFRVVDGLITNFHTPESSLFVMVSAFAGLDLLKKAYTRGIERKYRFFSYGDAMYFPPAGRL